MNLLTKRAHTRAVATARGRRLTPKVLLLACAVLLLPALAGCKMAAGQVLAQFELQLEPTELHVAAGTAENILVRVKPLTVVPFNSVTVRLIRKPVGVTADAVTVFTVSDWVINVGERVEPGEYELEAEAVSEGANLIPVRKNVKFTLVVE